jgi:hypothetical protein
MSAPAARCASCAAPVPHAALETGAAILLLGKAYCPSCKGAAAREVSLDDLSAPGPAAFQVSSAPSPPKAPPPRPAAAARPAARERAVPPSRAAPPRVSSTSKKPLLIGGAVLAALAAVAVSLALSARPEKPAPPDKDGAPPADSRPVSVPSTADPEARAKAAYAAVEPLLRRGDVEVDRLLAAIEAARPACKGTAYAERLEQARVKILANREKAEAGKGFDPLLEELKKAVADDAEFQRFLELLPKFQKARELAARAGPSAVSSLNALQQDYAGRYEKEAEPHYQRIQAAAEQLASERRYDDALKYIDSFPKHLRGSGAWRGLERLKEQTERDRKIAPKK